MTNKDRSILRELAAKKLEIVNSPLNLERRRQWYALHDGTPERPMILAEHGGISDGLKPFELRIDRNKTLECEDIKARETEISLRQDIWRFEKLRYDRVVEPFFNMGWDIHISDFGVSTVKHRIDDGDKLTAFSWDPPTTGYTMCHSGTYRHSSERPEEIRLRISQFHEFLFNTGK